MLDNKSDSGDVQMILKHQPIMIIVKIQNPKFKKFNCLGDGEYPIFPMANYKSFEFIQYIWFAYSKTSMMIQRSQFPLILGYAITGYKAQGATFERAMLDLKTPEGKGVGPINPADLDAYVPLSRMKTRSGLSLLIKYSPSIPKRFINCAVHQTYT